MITNINKKVICIKEIPSNLVEEAFFILKTDWEGEKNPQKRLAKKEIILQETKDFVRSYVGDIEKQKKNELKVIKHQKEKIILVALGFVLICFFLSMLMH